MYDTPFIKPRLNLRPANRQLQLPEATSDLELNKYIHTPADTLTRRLNSFNVEKHDALLKSWAATQNFGELKTLLDGVVAQEDQSTEARLVSGLARSYMQCICTARGVENPYISAPSPAFF